MNHSANVAGVGVGVDANGEEISAVLLAARDEYLPIAVTTDQARAIKLALAGEPFERPLTHDLLIQMITDFGGALDGVRIDDIADGTFYAKIDTERYDNGESRHHVFDARPSDAIALAVRAECQIEVSDDVLDYAGEPPSRFETASDEEQGIVDPSEFDDYDESDIDTDVDTESDPDGI